VDADIAAAVEHTRPHDAGIPFVRNGC
jgi:hypothetical protein